MLSKTFRVPDHDVEVQLRSINYGSRGTKFAVRVLEVRDRPVKDDWRQIGTEVVYAHYDEARDAIDRSAR